jgi:hypothetical protein
MAKDIRSESDSVQKSSRRSESILVTILFLFASWILVSFVHSLSIIGYADTVVAWIRSNVSMFRVTLIVGFRGSLLSIPFLRRQGHSREVLVRPVESHPVNVETRVHPLLLVPRPSRDSRFVIRKTKKRGRISRNRAGERLPPTIQG